MSHVWSSRLVLDLRRFCEATAGLEVTTGEMEKKAYIPEAAAAGATVVVTGTVVRGEAVVVATAWTIAVVSGGIAAVVVGRIVVVANGQHELKMSG